MIIEGTLSDKTQDDDLFLIHSSIPSALTTVSCALNPGLQTQESLRWLQTLSLTPTTSCERSGGTINTIIQAENVDAKKWRVATIIQATQKGRTILAPVIKRFIGRNSAKPMHADSLGSNDLDTSESYESRIRIE
jgi:hypothetical protein